MVYSTDTKTICQDKIHTVVEKWIK